MFEEAIRRALTRLSFVLAAGMGPVMACEIPNDPPGSVWAAATDHDTNGCAVSRFIPPELYTGADWNGEREIVLRLVDVMKKPLVPSDHPPISFRGPLSWQDDPSIQVIRRFRSSRSKGDVEQFFAINDRLDGLGRISDERMGRSRSSMAECFKFPLGIWRQRETRQCRESTIKIIEIDTRWRGIDHALVFRWNDEGTYVFAPERGMVATLY